jgi:hypothetical protein
MTIPAEGIEIVTFVVVAAVAVPGATLKVSAPSSDALGDAWAKGVPI